MNIEFVKGPLMHGSGSNTHNNNELLLNEEDSSRLDPDSHYDLVD